jgi:cell division protein FtsB
MPKKPPKEVLIQRNRAEAGLAKAAEATALRMRIAQMEREIADLRRQIPPVKP